jgi:putative transposase
MRKTEFANGEYYHIYNREVDKREVFLESKDYLRFLTCMNLLNDERDGLMEMWRSMLKANPRAKLSDSRELSSEKRPMVEIIAYCLNPNHYHFILKQVNEKGVEKFMHKISTGYTNYFNKKHDRSGSLFQGPFKSIHIDSNEYLLHLSVYVNANYAVHNYKEKDWPYSSYLDYTKKREGKLCVKETILGQFDDSPLEYEKFMQNNVDYFREKKELEKYILEC